MNEPALVLEGIEKAYNPGRRNEVRVLNGAAARIEAGEVVGLLAPSGAGKSTLLHIAGLLETADAGEIRIAGQAASGGGDRLRTRLRRDGIGFIYQFHHLLPEFSARENVALPQMAAGQGAAAARARADDLLGRVGLQDRLDHRPGELSGGEQQRVAFCRALANAPKLLLADEPTGNLDPDTSDRVFAAMLEVVRETGLGALIATHNHELAQRMDRVLRLDHGRLVAA
ncbi:ATP-binding cassette domain-containing protein [Rhodobacteraceae bacterium 2CG4]|uniref:ATP-binding cassette domain-containing protein n=1 Tax=Halovulum marinum TaxID=2662447 RepID=A0A6L5Z3I1_9RHOB|nr:ABC transporter ATP-binding protein [Halovulum marinum]MSU91087.1 ATP-binding cassette domain-containing protein [Halovulum marinum]